jgi:DNA-binding MarR family transcriptional regulator
MTDKIVAELIRKLDVLIGLTAIHVLEKKSQKEKVELLGRAGLAVKDIAALVGTTPNTVSVTLSKLRKNNGKAPKAKEKE